MLKDAGRFKHCEQLINGLPAKVRCDPGVRGAIALLHMEQNNSEAAAEELIQLCNQDPQTAGHWLNLAANLRSLKHCNAALKVLKRGICRQPEVTDLAASAGAVPGGTGTHGTSPAGAAAIGRTIGFDQG